MKKLTLIITFAIISASMFSQARKPEIMVVPSDVWCNSKGYIQTYDNQGLVEQIPDYKKAVKTDKELSNMIGKISNMMADRGFPLVDLSATISSIERRQAEDELITSKQGAAIAESPLDQLRRTAKADIILSLDWTVNENGPKRSVTYNLQGLDAYTNKVIAGVQGTGNPSLTAETAVLLEEAVVSNMDNFTSRLQDYFDDLFANGREVVVTVRVFDNSAGIDLDSEYDGYLLSEIIDEWMADNTVNSRFGKSDATENYINYHQVRIPLYNEKGRSMDTEMFVRNLARYLRQAPYNIPSKVMMRGLGEAILILGDK
ncbi:MAG: hypothetical protein IAC54_06155 [Bacteroidetes bacterium]|uniref:LPP20 lipoprotein n=1 Tax=Candidatus Caccoplasma merdipullorum TaxID=2840718 RepID=A0A9D9E4Y9_9BACT|nr:hypothetical protein [Candidatus Caccoplasma merdipullorum]